MGWVALGYRVKLGLFFHVGALDAEPELKVLLVADDDVAQLGDLAADFLRLLEAAHRRPELRAVVLRRKTTQ